MKLGRSGCCRARIDVEYPGKEVRSYVKKGKKVIVEDVIIKDIFHARRVCRECGNMLERGEFYWSADE